jgi:23S rRNA (cytosine1962-C5)-methyltransferase
MNPHPLELAIDFRQNLRMLEQTEALRLFHGPGESDHPELKHLAIDLFLDHIWITQWKPVKSETLSTVSSILSSRFKDRIAAIVLMDRSTVASEAEVITWSGTVKPGRFTVLERGIPYLVQMEKTKHPGLFLDHAPLRTWLRETQANKTVLNLFSYTGSLSVAAGIGGAAKVTTLDLSKPTIEWAKENWTHAGLPADRGDFIYGDVFEWLPKFEKRGLKFDTILSDPPSFSRGNKGTFSTQKDSGKLHEAILPLLKSGGILVTSINSENHSERNFLKDIEEAAHATQCTLHLIGRVDLPNSFPTPLDLTSRYLKGFYFLKA